MNIHNIQHTTFIGTVSGTVLSTMASIDPSDFLKTMILATIGATTSFILSIGLKWIQRKLLKASK